MFHVATKCETSFIETSESGTMQGSRLVPILYAIFVSLLFDIERMTYCADYNFILASNDNLDQ